MILVRDTDGTDGDMDIFQVSTGTYREGKRDEHGQEPFGKRVVNRFENDNRHIHFKCPGSPQSPPLWCVRA